MQVYFVTTVYLENGAKVIKRSRTVAFFPELEDAKKCVEENWGDIYEYGHYNYAVVECFGPGLYPLTKSKTWYVWSVNLECYMECDTPEGLENIVNFGIG